MVCPVFKTSPALTNIFLAKCVIDQNRKSTVKAADNTLNMLTQKATCSTLSPAKRENIRPINKKKGAPGGCGTSSLYEVAINSPQSQKLAVGSTVSVYTTRAIKKVIQPVIMLIFWYPIFLNNYQSSEITN